MHSQLSAVAAIIQTRNDLYTPIQSICSPVQLDPFPIYPDKQ